MTLSFLCCIFAIISSGRTIINLNVERNTDVATQLLKIRDLITFQNDNVTKVATYVYTIENRNDDIFVEFFENNTRLEHASIENDPNGTHLNLNVYLRNFLQPLEITTIRVEIVYIKKIKPLNKTRKYGESQLLRYTDNLYFYSIYFTENFMCAIEIKKPIVYSSEKFVPKNDMIIYRSINLKPFSSKKFTIIYENDDPFFVVNVLERTIDVSHYGSIFVEDNISIRNGGAKLIGPYNSYEAKRDWLYTYLPTSAENIKFFDILGNSSKTEVLYYEEFKALQFQMRYPFLSGWKSAYTLQYTVPTHEYLETDENKNYRLKMRIIDHVLNDVVIQNAVVKVLLPEGAKIKNLWVPTGFYRDDHELSYTSLCIFGRPTLEFHGSALIENHISPFTVDYYLPPLYMYKVPFLLAAYIQTVFVLIITFRRFNFKLK